VSTESLVEPIDPIAAADAVVTAIDPDLTPPGVCSRHIVLVTGPWMAGTTTLVTALRTAMPEHTFVEAGDLRAGDAPVAVVFVVSAIAPLTQSDCDLVDFATRHTDLVVGAVSKVDAHRNWRDVLAADQAVLASRTSRYRRMPWVGVAAAPDLGAPRLDELVGLLRQRLTDPDLPRRNRLRCWETQLEIGIARYEAEGAGVDREARVAALRKQRDDILRGRRLSKTERGIALRSHVQQARVQLTYFARKRCTSVRAELQEDVAELKWHRLRGFESYARDRAGDVVVEVDEGITKHLGDVAAELRLTAPPLPYTARPPDLPGPPRTSRRLEARLMMVLGAGFGLGVALAVTRLFAGVAPGLTIAGLIVGGLVGLGLTFWVVGIRGLLHDRALLDRWVVELMTIVRSSVEELVATRLVAAEAALVSDQAGREEFENEIAADRIAQIDAELRDHALSTARAAKLRDRRVPILQRALDAARAQLNGAGVIDASGAEVAADHTDSTN
jgi:hypothetical protein